ncbi:MAG: cation transporter [Chloroflexi bacterium]|nr:cation transporter [Chloroflexota bacterium]
MADLHWTSFYVDSIDRRDWMARIEELAKLPGVSKVVSDPRSGQVRFRYDPELITPFQLRSHLRAAGL